MGDSDSTQWGSLKSLDKMINEYSIPKTSLPATDGTEVNFADEIIRGTTNTAQICYYAASICLQKKRNVRQDMISGQKMLSPRW
jgi:hypothetical protein